MRRAWLALGSVALISAVIVPVGAPSAIGQPAIAVSCTELTVGRHPSSSAVMNRLSDVPLTGDQKKVIEAAVASLQSGGYVRFGGALIPIAPFLTDNGITPDVIPQIKAAITAATPPTHPPGWPCAPFVNKARVTAWLRAKLIANGYRPAMTFFNDRLASDPRERDSGRHRAAGRRGEDGTTDDHPLAHFRHAALGQVVYVHASFRRIAPPPRCSS
jgi:hypothetical protein